LTLPEETGSHEGSSSAGSVSGKHQVEVIVDAHQLTDAGLHDVRKVRVEPEKQIISMFSYNTYI
jgi:hypothetical protein